MAKRVIRLTEQELSKVLSDILNMTGAFGRKEKKDNFDHLMRVFVRFLRLNFPFI